MSQNTNIPSQANLLDEAQKILASITIPSPPRVLIGIQEELSKPEPSFTKVLTLISEDVAMTAKVIKVANSPFFATRYPIKGLEMALPILGLENFRSIVLTSALRHAFEASGMDQEEMNTFHEHSLIMARACQTVAQHLSYKGTHRIDSGLAYMAGLFHDCGMPLLAQRFPAYFSELRHASGDELQQMDFEEARYRTNHSIIGSFVAKAWHLPDELNQAIIYHHGALPEDGDEIALNLAALIRTAEGLLEHVAEISDEDLIYYQTEEDQAGFNASLQHLELMQGDLETLSQKIGKFLSVE